MFIEDFTDEQYLELRLTTSDLILDLWKSTSLYEYELAGWVTINKEENFRKALTIGGKSYLQLRRYIDEPYGNFYNLFSPERAYFLTDSDVSLVKNNAQLIFVPNVIVNPEGDPQ